MRTIQVLGLVPILALSLAACTGGTSTTAQALTVEAVDLSFTPMTLEVTAGQPVKLTLQNNGALEHDFSITEIPMEGMAEETGGTEHDMGDAAAEPELHMAAAGGQGATLEFTPSTPGTYEFWCTVAGHKEAGMTGTLVVNAP
jgi:uncharacterized cupredoxin-like copper-binding protein